MFTTKFPLTVKKIHTGTYEVLDFFMQDPEYPYIDRFIASWYGDGDIWASEEVQELSESPTPKVANTTDISELFNYLTSFASMVWNNCGAPAPKKGSNND